MYQTYQAPEYAPETEEQKAARLVRERAAEERATREREAIAEANRKADLLLREYLTSDQLEQLARDKWFDVVGSVGGKTYRLCLDGRVYELGEASRVIASFCIYPREEYPTGDIVLAKKLLLEVDEEQFLRTANRTAI